MAAGQGELDLRLPGSPANQGAALPIASSRIGHLLDALGRGYDVLGVRRDEVFTALVLAGIIEPTSKLDSLRVLTEAGMDPPSYRTVKRRLRIYAGADQNPDDAARKPMTRSRGKPVPVVGPRPGPVTLPAAEQRVRRCPGPVAVRDVPPR
ncbi:hypothetical protein [Salinispora arenicola]|uniref:hypothetical protein n=1 Tax=Salinispora arenicola TaxID=168697 RepID=UPI0003F9B08D